MTRSAGEKRECLTTIVSVACRPLSGDDLTAGGIGDDVVRDVCAERSRPGGRSYDLGPL